MGSKTWLAAAAAETAASAAAAVEAATAAVAPVAAVAAALVVIAAGDNSPGAGGGYANQHDAQGAALRNVYASKGTSSGEKAPSSRAARRDAMRQNNTPTSRPAISQSGSEGRRQTVVEGSDGKPRVQTQHPPDKTHPDPHWHDGKPKTDPNTGEMRKNSHGQIKDENVGRSTTPY